MVMEDGFWIAGGTGRAGLLDSGWMSERLIASKVENILAGFPSLHFKGSFFIICWIESLSDHQPWSSKLRENLLPFSLSTPQDLPHTWHDFVHARAKTWIGSSTLHCAMPPGRVFQFYQSNLGVNREQSIVAESLSTSIWLVECHPGKSASWRLMHSNTGSVVSILTTGPTLSLLGMPYSLNFFTFREWISGWPVLAI